MGKFKIRTLSVAEVVNWLGKSNSNYGKLLTKHPDDAYSYLTEIYRGASGDTLGTANAFDYQVITTAIEKAYGLNFSDVSSQGTSDSTGDYARYVEAYGEDAAKEMKNAEDHIHYSPTAAAITAGLLVAFYVVRYVRSQNRKIVIKRGLLGIATAALTYYICVKCNAPLWLTIALSLVIGLFVPRVIAKALSIIRN